jgi:hypothetical protein
MATRVTSKHARAPRLSVFDSALCSAGRREQGGDSHPFTILAEAVPSASARLDIIETHHLSLPRAHILTNSETMGRGTRSPPSKRKKSKETRQFRGQDLEEKMRERQQGPNLLQAVIVDVTEKSPYSIVSNRLKRKKDTTCTQSDEDDEDQPIKRRASKRWPASRLPSARFASPSFSDTSDGLLSEKEMDIDLDVAASITSSQPSFASPPLPTSPQSAFSVTTQPSPSQDSKGDSVHQCIIQMIPDPSLSPTRRRRPILHSSQVMISLLSLGLPCPNSLKESLVDRDIYVADYTAQHWNTVRHRFNVNLTRPMGGIYQYSAERFQDIRIEMRPSRISSAEAAERWDE